MRIVVGTAASLLALALTVPAAGAAPGTGTTATATPTATGLWRMDGYGTVLAIDGRGMQEYQTTAVSCLKGYFAEAAPKPGTYGVEGVVLTVRPAPDGEHARFGADVAVGHRQLHRIGALPAACTRPPAADPRTAFDVFWQSFEENYPFFAAKGIDWHAVRDHYRPLVRKDTTRDQLFDIFSRMITPLHDAHVLVLDGDRHYGVGRPGTVVPTEELNDMVEKFVVERDLAQATDRQDFAGGLITYADLKEQGLGYLRIASFDGYDRGDPSYTAQLAELDRALNTILTPARTRSLRGLVIDLRINGGGSDALGIRIAERLTDTPYVAYSKRARNYPADPTKHTRPEPIPVTPSPKPRYTGPVALLTGGSTVSAGETFTQALIDRPGHTVRIGQATQGVFSDVMTRDLPDGMAVWLPNEEYLTWDDHTFDGTGIPPQITEPVFTDEEFTKNRDSAFDRAVTLLRSAR
ncbi:S41 family peptidase [Streptomyces sp. GbtcB6]|uniref:S41 family peptidase n=1 Tax=Streptomyces sp. GbtcB6 TaxID=2824751 RepID=UPI001C2F6C8C|nr:S41 family peptidase [Streptomyces sp. GbtcB6]